MSNAYLQGVQNAFDNQSPVRNDVHVVSTNWFVNRCPLVSRLPRAAAGSTTFEMVSRTYRSRVATLATSLIRDDRVIRLGNATSFVAGDVLELPSGERMRVLSNPTPDIISVQRGVEGTTATYSAAGDRVTLIGTGHPGFPLAAKSDGVHQYCQTWISPVRPWPSIRDDLGRQPFDQDKMDALQTLMDDMEVSCYMGVGADPATDGRPMQKGLKTLLSVNNVTSPLNTEAYAAADFIRDVIQPCKDGGGDPDVILLGSFIEQGFAAWGWNLRRIDAGVNVFGTPIDVFSVPALGGISVIPCPLLQPDAAICLTSSGLRLRMKRNEFWSPRGVRGDDSTGEWVAEGAIEVENPGQHSWLEGVKRFSN